MDTSAQALVVVDVQRAFVSGAEAVPAAEALLDVVGVLLSRARSSGALVVHLQNDGPPGALDEPGAPGWGLHLPVLDHPQETVLRKVGDDGFRGTGLGGLLERCGVDGVVVCGLLSEMCVAATARGALARGYRVVLPHDAHATYDIPATAGIAEGVPHGVVSRVAEWSLGDEVVVPPRAADVRFSAVAKEVR